VREVLAVLVLLASISTYFSASGKTIFYLVFLAVFFAYVFSRGIKELRNKSLLVIPAGYFLATVMSLVINYQYVSEDAFQSLLYPFIFLLVLLGAYRILQDLGYWGSRLIILFFVANGLTAALSVLGVFSSLPLFGEILRGRYIFGTNIASSAGLIWNVNYYSITQLLGFWLSIFCFHYFRFNRYWIGVSILIGASIIFGSSRSVSLSFIASLAMYLYLNSSVSLKRLFEVGGGVLVFFLGALYTYVANDADLSVSLRVDRGLNGRDELWEYAFGLFEKSPVFGIFSIAEIERLLVADAGSANTTLQNTFLFTLIRLGIFGVFFLLLFVLACIIGFIGNKNKTKADFALFCCFLCLIFDSMVRTYSLGGIGFGPLMLAVCGCNLLMGKKTV